MLLWSWEQTSSMKLDLIRICHSHADKEEKHCHNAWIVSWYRWHGELDRYRNAYNNRSTHVLDYLMKLHDGTSKMQFVAVSAIICARFFVFRTNKMDHIQMSVVATNRHTINPQLTWCQRISLKCKYRWYINQSFEPVRKHCWNLYEWYWMASVCRYASLNLNGI